MGELSLVLSLNYCVLSLAAEPIRAVVFSLLMRVMRQQPGVQSTERCQALRETQEMGCRSDASPQRMENPPLFLSETPAL